MPTTGAARAARVHSDSAVLSRKALASAGVDRTAVHAQLDARRWRRFGEAVVLHNGPLTRAQRWEITRLAVGPDALLTAFTVAEALGLRRWERERVHVLGPAGARISTPLPFPVQLHRTGDWARVRRHWRPHCHDLPDALVLAASTLPNARHGYGLLAAAVQQRLVLPEALQDALRRASRTRHRATLRLAVEDIAGGSEALSEIDFVRLCRRAGLPEPIRQAVRSEPGGRRRYLDAEWVLADGRRVVVEVDGAVHLAAERWFGDQLRQNAITLSGALVLRFPSIVVRTDPQTVIAQLRQALGTPGSRQPAAIFIPSGRYSGR